MKEVSINPEESISNVIDIGYVLERIQWILLPENIQVYFLSLCAKLFYVTYASFGTIWISLYILYKMCRESEIRRECMVLFYFYGALVVMLLACLFAGAGMTDNYTYYFYARYYLNILVPVTAISIALCIKRGDCLINSIRYASMAISLFLGLCTLGLSNILIVNDSHMDMIRVPDFGIISKHTENYEEMILMGMLINISLIAIMIRNDRLRYISVLIIAVLTIWNARISIDHVRGVNKDSIGDYTLAKYIEDNVDEDELVMIEDYSYRWIFYPRMEILLKNKKLDVIYCTEDEVIQLPTKGHFLTYTTSPIRYAEMKGKIEFVGSRFILYNVGE